MGICKSALPLPTGLVATTMSQEIALLKGLVLHPDDANLTALREVVGVQSMGT